MIFPGPPFIDPDTAPQGIVLHCYRVPQEELLFVQYLTGLLSDHEIDKLADEGTEAAFREGATNVCLVAYDGDSGERLSVRDWFDPGFVP
jgi:hypothetical protein